MAKGGSGYRRQAGGGLTSGPVNTGFALDMQRKLYRWSAADPEKRFADLFNLVCDRRMIAAAWKRLSRNKGSQTPGTDRMTRRKVEERAGGAAAFLEEIWGELRNGTYKPQPVRQRLIPKPGKPESSDRWVSPAQSPIGANDTEAGAGTNIRGGLLPDLLRVPAW